MKGIKTKLIKYLPNNKEIKFKSNHFVIDNNEYILWSIRREGKTIWIEMEDNSLFTINMGGRYYISYTDIDIKLYPYIIKYLKGVIF